MTAGPRIGTSALLVFLAGCALVHERIESVDAGPNPFDAARIVDAPADTSLPVSRAIGAACASAADCPMPSPFCIPPSLGAPGGYCSSPCMVDDMCGPGAVCDIDHELPVAPFWYGACLASCSSAAPCRTGYVCATYGGYRACVPDCRLEPRACGASACDAATGACAYGCHSDADCSEGSGCDIDMGACRCTAATMCLPGTQCFDTNGVSGQCGCTSDAACGAGWHCNTFGACCSTPDMLCIF